MADHTSTPWKLAGTPDNMIVCDAEGGSIADCAPPGPWMRDKEALANAAFIVKAVNCHDHLVKALEASCGYLLNAKIDLGTGCTKATAIRTIEGGLLRAQAVLALIKEPA